MIMRPDTLALAVGAVAALVMVSVSIVDSEAAESRCEARGGHLVTSTVTPTNQGPDGRIYLGTPSVQRTCETR
jgi:hypothetical protein